MAPPLKFERNADLDARMILASMRGGHESFMSYAFARRDVFAKPGDAVARADWLKRQPQSYIKEVCDLAAKLEADGQ
jgi:hypothetical protein